MRRFGFVQSTASALLLVTAIYAVTAACVEDLTAPCAQETSKLNSRGLLDGSWIATTIDGSPANNYLLLPTFDRLVSGSIEFQTTSVSGDCDAPSYSNGHAVAVYTIRKASGEVKPKRFLGRFLYNHKDHTLELSAAGYTVGGTVNGVTMTMSASHSVIGDRTVVLQLGGRP
jgi:hypothetical protein